MSAPLLTPWRKASADVDLDIDDGSVHLWRFSLSEFPSQEILVASEKSRAERLRIPEKKRAFITARTRLRQILGHYLKISPRDVEFEYSENGKPSLQGRRFDFNLSHSGDWAICVVSRKCAVGVDVERISNELNYSKLARRFFSQAENAWLNESSEVRCRRNFFRLWTRKEAWLKCKGAGFSELNLELDPAHLAVMSAVVDGWWLMNLPIAKGYVGAIAVADEVQIVERWSWTEKAR